LDDLILSIVAGYLLPLITVYGAYVITHGHLSPGGGFAGGTIISAGLILAAMAWGFHHAAKVFSENTLGNLDTLGSSGYVLTGIAATAGGGLFLTNLDAGFAPGTPGALFSAGAIWILGALIGIKVSTTVFGLVARVWHDEAGAEDQP
jgi:multicomponent Na+:H+ antiporter subunit B